MINIPLAQAKNQLSELIGRVERGETVAVTRRGKPVAMKAVVDAAALRHNLRQVRRALDVADGIGEEQHRPHHRQRPRHRGRSHRL